jgi:DNA-binding NtrC family response regulator
MEVRRVGGTRTIPFDVRLITTTRYDLDREVQEGRFREDLYHRLAAARIELPPLRSRRGDVRVLSEYFCRETGNSLASLSRSTLGRWEEARWPGNVRELRHAVAREIALGDAAMSGNADEGQDEEPALRGLTPPSEVFAQLGLAELPLFEARQRLLELFDRFYLETVLSRHGGRVTAAAATAGIARRYFQILRARLRSTK